MNVILIGYRGSGKTTIGLMLADRLGYDFVDTDERIMQIAGKNIKEIFEQDGQEAFRDLETKVILDVAAKSDHVISVGGGAVLREQNRQAIRGNQNRVIYLNAAAEELFKRIHSDSASAANRPSLTHLGGNIEEIRSLLAVREPIYRSVCTDVVDVAPLSPVEVVAAIVNRLSIPSPVQNGIVS